MDEKPSAPPAEVSATVLFIALHFYPPTMELRPRPGRIIKNIIQCRDKTCLCHKLRGDEKDSDSETESDEDSGNEVPKVNEDTGPASSLELSETEKHLHSPDNVMDGSQLIIDKMDSNEDKVKNNDLATGAIPKQRTSPIATGPIKVEDVLKFDDLSLDDVHCDDKGAVASGNVNEREREETEEERMEAENMANIARCIERIKNIFNYMQDRNKRLIQPNPSNKSRKYRKYVCKLAREAMEEHRRCIKRATHVNKQLDKIERLDSYLSMLNGINVETPVYENLSKELSTNERAVSQLFPNQSSDSEGINTEVRCYHSRKALCEWGLLNLHFFKTMIVSFDELSVSLRILRRDYSKKIKAAKKFM